MIKSISLFCIFILSSTGLLSQNSCLNFDGLNDHVEVQNPTSMTLSREITMEAWVNPNTSTGFRIILNKEGEYEMGIHNGQFIFAIANDWIWKYTGFIVPTNQWTHLAVSYNSISYKAYVNGELVYTELSGGAIYDIVPDQNEFWVGYRQALLNHHFSGEIDEVRIWNKALNSSEISDLHNDEFLNAATLAECLVAYFTLNEASGFTAKDRSGNDNDGTLINMLNSDWVDSGANITVEPPPVCSEIVLVDEEQLGYNIKVFPNPTSRYINVQIDNADLKQVKIQIVNYLGALVWENQADRSSISINKEIEIENNGIYVLVIQIGDKVYSQRVVVTN